MLLGRLSSWRSPSPPSSASGKQWPSAHWLKSLSPAGKWSMAEGPASLFIPVPTPTHPGQGFACQKQRVQHPMPHTAPEPWLTTSPPAFPSSLGAFWDGLRVKHLLGAWGGRPLGYHHLALHSLSSLDGCGCSPCAVPEHRGLCLGRGTGLQEPPALPLPMIHSRGLWWLLWHFWCRGKGAGREVFLHG